MSKPAKVLFVLAALVGAFWAGQRSQSVADERGLEMLDSLNALAPTVGNPSWLQPLDARRRL